MVYSAVLAPLYVILTENHQSGRWLSIWQSQKRPHEIHFILAPSRYIYYFYSVIKPYIIFDQATWITAVGLPVYFCNALPRQAHPPLGGRDYLALGLYATSFLFEAIADRQKSTWRKAKEKKEHDEQFISTGLWSVSRHPKYGYFQIPPNILDSQLFIHLSSYVGEVGIWTGIWALSSASLQSSFCPRGTIALAAISPLFTWFLLRNVCYR